MIAALGKVLTARTPATSVAQSLLMKVLVLVLSLCCGMVTARSLGPAGRGEQSAIVLWPYLVCGVAGFGIAPAVCYYTSRNKEREGGLLVVGSLLAFVGGLLGAAIGAVVITRYLGHYSGDIISAARLMLLFVPLILIGYVFRANLEARANFTSSNQSRVWPFVYTLGALIILWATHRLTPITAALALFVPLALQSVWLGYRLARHFVFVRTTFATDVRDLLSYGLRTCGADVFYTLSTQVDLAFIIAFLSPAALGIYTIALTAARQLNLLQVSLNMVLLPKASGLDFDAALDLVGRMARISTLITAAGTLIALVVLPALIPLFYGTAFLSAGVITRILILETFLMSIASVFAQAFNSTGRPGIVTGFQAGWVATSILFLFLLVPRLGLSGAAIALTLSSFVRLIATLAAYPLVLRRPVPALVPTRADIGYLRYKFGAYTRRSS